MRRLYLLPLGLALLMLCPVPKPKQNVSSIAAPVATPVSVAPAAPKMITREELEPLLLRAGQQYHIDKDLLGSLLKVESGGQVNAVSRTGAQGLMQLMPQTAAQMGVIDSFVPEQNIAGGAAYMGQLLKHYHDRVKLAVAAYNAGPHAVDRYHGVPPFAETRNYVRRVLFELNRRKQAERALKTVVAAMKHSKRAASLAS